MRDPREQYRPRRHFFQGHLADAKLEHGHAVCSSCFASVLGARALSRWAMSVPEGDSGRMLRSHGRPVPVVPSSAFAGFRFPPEIIVLTARWYLRFGLSYRDVEEPLAERGIEGDHVSVFRWVQRFTPLLADAARPCRHAVGDRWYADETYVKSRAGGATSIEPSINTARSSTSTSQPAGIPTLLDGSSQRRFAFTASRSRLWPIGRGPC
jgi:hypothetical protein